MSSLVSTNVTLPYGRTSIRLERELWSGLADICEREAWTRNQAVIKAIAAYSDRGHTSAVRTFVFEYFRKRAESATSVDRLSPDEARL